MVALFNIHNNSNHQPSGTDQNIFAIAEDIHRRLFDGDEAHGIHHARMVCRISLNISNRQHPKADLSAVVFISYFHDLVVYPKNSQNSNLSSLHSAEKAVETLKEEYAHSNHLLDVIYDGIANNSFSGGKIPIYEEGKIVQDSDRLCALGALGIARTFYVAGKMGSKIFDEADPWANFRQLDDKQFALDHFFTKLLTLERTMNTSGGRIFARERVRLMKSYLDAIRDELTLSESNIGLHADQKHASSKSAC